ncbi:MAG: zinc ribbon domain-containing protein [Candidatus Heimdallarchaeota archaeon]|nr:zinc ribbon domain-containing protein [Candidatus Heimdallarchaeota archaeon]
MFNIVTPVTSDTLFIENLTSDGGSQYEYYMESDNYNSSKGFTILEGEDFEITVGIKVISLASSVNDFHDIFLYVSLVNNEGLTIVTSHFLGKLFENFDKADSLFQFDSTEFQYAATDSSTKYYTNFNILIGSTFREDVSLSTDPSTDDRWHFLHEVDVVSEIADEAVIITSQPEQFIDNEINITTSVEPRTTTPPEPNVIPSSALVVSFLILLGVGVLFFQRRSRNRFVSSGSIPRKKIEITNSELTKSRSTPISAKLCPSCGTLNTDLSQFCMECGVHLP